MQPDVVVMFDVLYHNPIGIIKGKWRIEWPEKYGRVTLEVFPAR
jgi:hypothetical protein